MLSQHNIAVTAHSVAHNLAGTVPWRHTCHHSSATTSLPEAPYYTQHHVLHVMKGRYWLRVKLNCCQTCWLERELLRTAACTMNARRHTSSHISNTPEAAVKAEQAVVLPHRGGKGK
jgi:hypothetical protein